MKVLLVNGSPRAKGCTYTALSEVARILEQEGIETEIFQLGAKPVQDCIACMKCRENGAKCVFDDVANELIEKAKGADGFVFGSPVYYAHPSGRIQSVLDRAFYAGSYAFAGKPTYWNMVYGKTPDEVRRDEEGMQTMRNLARNMAYMLKCFEAGKKAGIEAPAMERTHQTNFIR